MTTINVEYNWKRFWCPRTGKVNLSDGGYLLDPDTTSGKYFNPHVVPFESMASTPCLVLLGEPGIGKTHAMCAERESIDAYVREKGDEVFWLDLRSYGSEDRLIADLFGNSTFRAWMEGDHQLHLFLDSVDECLIRIDTLAAILIEELRKCPIERLYLRLACRTADWPSGLEHDLRRLWGNDSLGILEMTPLRRADVIEAVSRNDLDPDAFLEEVEHVHVVPLAIKPVTLEFLLRQYRESRSFPSTQQQLYLDGCRELCNENNQNRRSPRLRGTLSAEQRLAVAARIAAITVFANRTEVYTGTDQAGIAKRGRNHSAPALWWDGNR